MAKIAFLGLGQMGTPMATRLLEAGHALTVWNRTPDRAKPLASRGATVAGSPAEAGAGAAFAITMLATPQALTDVVLGEHGLVRALGPGQVYVDTFTSPTHRTGCRPRASTSRRAQRTAQALNARRLATPSLRVCARGL